MASVVSYLNGSPAVDGQKVSGKLAWEAKISGVANVGRVEFRIDADAHPPDGIAGVWTEHAAPYSYMGDNQQYDTTRLQNGRHALGVRVFNTAGKRVATSRIGVDVQNAVTPSPPPPPTGVLRNGDFSTGDFSQYDSTYFMRTDGSSGAVVDDPRGAAAKCARFTVKPGDNFGDNYGGAGHERAQIQWNTNEGEGVLSRYTWGVYLPPDFKDAGSFFNVITEWHHYSKTLPYGHSPPITFQWYAGRYVCRVVNSNDPTQSIYWTAFDMGAAPLGAWADFDVSILHSSDPAKAYIDISRDGQHQQKITGKPTRYAGDYVNYLIAGWYRGAATVTQTIYLRNLRRLAV